MVTCLVITASAEDWTGKKIKTKDDVKPGKREGAGLLRGSDVVKKGTELTVKADDGTFLELDGKLGTIFKTDAVLSSNDPNALPSDGTTWKAGTVVFQRQEDTVWVIERRSEKNLATVKVNWEPKLEPTVLRDGEDGSVLLTDGASEGWAEKNKLLTSEDVPVWAERRLKSNPKDTYALWVRAYTLTEQGKYEAAEKDYTAAIQADATVSVLWSARGQVRRRLGDWDGSIADFTEAHRLNSADLSPLPMRGLCWMRKGEYSKAEVDFTAWHKANPDDVVWHPYRVNAYYHLGEWKKAIADADLVLKANPKDVYTRVAKARSMAKLKRYKEAKDEFESQLYDIASAVQYVAYAQFLSICPDADFRDGVTALQLMKLTQSSYDNAKRDLPAEILEVFAAVYAEGAEYELAVEKQKEAVEKLKADKRTPAAELKRAEEALELYKKNKPLRDE